MARFSYGGQALLEGVMMRGRDSLAVAFRHPDGRILWATERLDSGFHGSRLAKAPLVRGLVVLYETLVVGTQWLVRSASIQAEEDGVELGKGTVATMLLITFVMAVGIFFLLPLFLASITTAQLDNGLAQHAVEGLIRVLIFMAYLLVISRQPDIRRVFQYHGAEHMTIHAWEAGDPLTVDKVRPYPTAHPRCGTEFLVIVILLSIVAFSLVGRQDAPVMIASRIILIPVIAALGYELLKWAAKRRGNPIVRALTYPGILVQMITTKRPSDDMIEVAIVSLQQALKADHEEVPADAAAIAREPLQMPGLPPSAIPDEVEAGLAAVREREATSAAATAGA